MVILGSNSSWHRQYLFLDFLDFCLIIIRIFQELFVRFVRSNCFHQTVCIAAIFLVRKSSKSEPSSRFFGRLKILNFWPCIIKSHTNYWELPLEEWSRPKRSENASKQFENVQSETIRKRFENVPKMIRNDSKIINPKGPEKVLHD